MFSILLHFLNHVFASAIFAACFEANICSPFCSILLHVSKQIFVSATLVHVSKQMCMFVVCAAFFIEHMFFQLKYVFWPFSVALFKAILLFPFLRYVPRCVIAKHVGAKRWLCGDESATSRTFQLQLRSALHGAQHGRSRPWPMWEYVASVGSRTQNGRCESRRHSFFAYACEG